MKFRFSATIAFYFLFTLLWTNLNTYASEESYWLSRICDKVVAKQEILKIENQKEPDNEQVLLKKENENEPSQNERRLVNENRHNIGQILFNTHEARKIPKYILYIIFYEYLTVQEILVFRATCKISKDLLEPDKYNMVTFSEAIYPNKDVYLAWIDFTVYFQHKNLSELKKNV